METYRIDWPVFLISRGDFCFHRALDDTDLKFGILSLDTLSRKFPSGRKRLYPLRPPERGGSPPKWVYSWFNDGILLDIMKKPTTKILSPLPSPAVRYGRKRVFSFAKFAVAFYSTDFLETCTNDGGDTLSVIFSEFLSWWNKGKIH